MNLGTRIALAIVIVIVDFVSFIIPLGSLTIAWVLVAKPRWAIDFMDRLYAEDEPEGPKPTEPASPAEGPASPAPESAESTATRDAGDDRANPG